MRVVSWNMGCAGRKYRATHEDAWRYLLDSLKPDIALVQEAMLASPSWIFDRGRLLLRRAYGSQDWGSGIFLQAGNAVPKDVTLHGSYVAVAEMTTAGDEPLVVASVHVCPDNKQRQYLRELLDYFKLTLQGRFVVAGDFNAARLYDEINKKNAYRWFFDEIGRMGFYDCHWGLHQREVASCWPTRGTRYQTDHVFVDMNSASHVLSCEVDQDANRKLSDHAPLILTLAAPDAA